MLNRVYRLIEPRTIEPVEVSTAIPNGDIVVRPTHLSICNADQRYYQGSRPSDVMARKLPMALIHEGIGCVIHDTLKQISPGTKVVLIPNTPTEHDSVIAENYLRSSAFSGSGHDGFMQELCVMNRSRVIALPKEINSNVAAFTELVSVVVHAVTRFDRFSHNRRNIVGVWGDGNMGFIVSLVLRMVFPAVQIYVFGRNGYKLSDFTFADRTFLSNSIPEGIQVDHAFECCGGEGAAYAIEQIIDLIKPEGTMSLLGVSENPVSINTRMVLEKGLRLFGSSRSGVSDFERTLELYRNHPEMLDYLESLVGSVISVESVRDIGLAFEADIKKTMGKTIMEWQM